MPIKNVAVVLSGSGVFDGSEIHEATLVLLGLERLGVKWHCFSPNRPQHHVTNHFTGQRVDEKGQTRLAIEEAARIARGSIQPLEKFDSRTMDGIILPGGAGVISTLCDYIDKDIEAAVDPILSKILKEMYSLRKPIGATCIAPLLLGLVFAHKVSLKLTLGTQKQELAKLQSLGMQPVACDVHSIVVDESHKIITTPAYMEHGATIADIWVGIEKLCSQLARL